MRKQTLAAVLAILLGGGAYLFAQEQVKPVPAKPEIKEHPVTKAKLQERLGGLEAGKSQAIANVQAYDGAIQECKYWIEELENAEKLASDAAKKPAKDESPKMDFKPVDAGSKKKGGGG